MRAFRFLICTSVLSALALPAALAVSIRFAREGAPKAVEHQPRALGVRLRADGQVVRASFDRPMVEPAGIGTPAPIGADAAGRAVWTGVARAEWRAEGALAPGRRVRFEVREAASLDGTRQKGVEGCEIHVPGGLEICGDGLPATTGSRPRFAPALNAVVDAARLERAAVFRSGRSSVRAKLRDGALEPAEALPPGTVWELVIRSGLAAPGLPALGWDWRHEFRVDGAMELEVARAWSSLSQRDEIEIRFSNEIAVPTLRPRIRLEPAAEFDLGVWGDRATLYGEFRAGTTVWVTIEEGVEDLHGQRMGRRTEIVHVPPHRPALELTEESGTVERHGVAAVPLFCVNVPQARVALRRGVRVPWAREGGEETEVRVIRGNAEPDEVFNHGVRFPGPGIWDVEAQAVGMREAAARRYQVTDLGLTFRLGRTRSLACVTSLDTAKAVPGADLSLHDREGGLLWRGVSGADGCAEVPGRTEMAGDPEYLLARAGDDAAWIDLDEVRLSPWRLPVAWQDPGKAGDVPVFLFTDRPVYRPGDRVHVKGWWRGATARAVQVELRAWNDEVEGTTECAISSTGGFDAEFPLPENACAETWRVVARAGGGRAEARFEVAWYRTPPFEVKVAMPARRLFPGDRFEAEIGARTFFGMAMAGADVTWRATLEDGGPLASGCGVLDGDGRLALAFPLGPKAGRLTLEAEVADACGGTECAQAGAPVETADLVLRARPETQLADAGRPLGVVLEAARLDGGAWEGTLSVKFVRRTWSWVQKRVAGGGWSYVDESRDDLVAELSAQPGRIELLPAAPGTHVLEVRGRDAAGRERVLTAEIDVAGAGAAGWRRRDDARVDLVPDRESYRPGDVARVLLRGAPAGARVLVTLERDGVLERRWVEAGGGAPVVEVPIRAEHAPNVFLSVTAIRGRTSRAPGAGGTDPGKPRVCYGSVSLAVEMSGARLETAVRVPTRAAPGAEITVEVVAAPGAEVALAVVDAAVLSLIGAPDPDPLAFFERPLPLSVDASDTRRDLASLVPLDVRGRKGRPGGGGGGPSVRRDFRGTAHWSPRLVADAAGVARATFRLPDNTTRWRAIAVAAADGRWGHAAAEFEADRPLVLAPALPRFALLGDRFTARVLVHNRTGAAGRARVECNGETVDIDVPAGRSAAAGFPVEVTAMNDLRFAFRASLGGHEDRVDLVVPVRFPAPAETIVLSGSADRSARVELPEMDRVESVTLAAGASPLASLEAELRRLLAYPHGCVEQTSSGTLAVLALRGLGIPEADGRIEAGVRRLLSMQVSEGGFSYWPGGDDPHPAGTACACHALALAARAGFAVEERALSRGLDWLEAQLGGPRAAVRAYALYVLALAGRPRPSWLESIEPDPILALAAAEMGLPDRARGILRSGSAARAGTAQFASPAKMEAARLLVRARIGDPVDADPEDLLTQCVITYERAWGLLALAACARPAAAAPVLRVTSAGVQIAKGPLDPVLRAAAPPAAPLRLEADGPFHWSVAVRGARLEAGAEDRGFWVRRCFSRTGNPAPRTEFALGQLVEVRVFVWCREPREYVALEIPLPAGLEPVDTRLRNAARVDEESGGFDHVEKRDDRIFASALWLSEGVHELVTVARAATPGRFTVPAPRAEEMYDPAVNGRGEAQTIEVTPR